MDFVLGNQEAAKAYKNRVVVVTGTIDQANKTIHVQKTEAAAWGLKENGDGLPSFHWRSHRGFRETLIV
jgi:hypothetical protein